MNKSFIAGIAIGAVVGSVASWIYARKKYEQIVQEEIESVKAAFEEYYTEVENIILEKPVVEEKVTKEEKEEYKEVVENTTYISCDLKNGCSDPYVIAPEELGGEQNEYNIISLTYYADGVLADSTGEVYNIGNAIGDDALEHFGQYEDDVVHVRNEAWNTDFEIFQDERNYTEVF